MAGWFLLIGIPLYALQALGMASVAPVALLVTVLFTATLAFGSIGVDEVQGTEALWCSLPVSRRDAVLARYVSTAAGTVFGLVLSWAVGRLAMATIFHDARGGARLLGAGTHVTLFAMLLFCAAVYLPCRYGLGAGRGLVAASAILFGLLVTVSLLGGLVLRLAGGADAVQALREQDPARLAAAQDWLERWGLLLRSAVAAGAVVLFGVSAAVSVRLDSKRDC